MLPLPEKPCVLARWSAATVGPDIHVKVGRAVYSVPWRATRRPARWSPPVGTTRSTSWVSKARSPREYEPSACGDAGITACPRPGCNFHRLTGWRSDTPRARTSTSHLAALRPAHETRPTLRPTGVRGAGRQSHELKSVAPRVAGRQCLI
ncbi:hypothetical protein EF912_21900 [Streptomyces sp. WAC07061]|nr:hypothetical protein EF912_21900 [Streptomyces sp. WAC07061]